MMKKFALSLFLLCSTADLFNIMLPLRQFSLLFCTDPTSPTGSQHSPLPQAYSSQIPAERNNPKFVLYDPWISSENPFYIGNRGGRGSSEAGSASAIWTERANCNFIASRRTTGGLVSLADAKGVAGLGKAGGDGAGGSDKAGQQVPPEVYNALTYAGTAFLFTLSVPLILYGLNKLLNKIEDCFGCGPSSRKETTKNGNSTDNSNSNNRAVLRSHDGSHNHQHSFSSDTNGTHKITKKQSDELPIRYGEHGLENRQLYFSQQQQHQQPASKMAHQHILSDSHAGNSQGQMSLSDIAMIEPSDGTQNIDRYALNVPNLAPLAPEYPEQKQPNLSSLYKSPGSAVMKLA